MSRDNTGRNWLAILGVLLAFFVVLNVISYVWMPFLPWTEQRQAGEEIVKEQMDADQALQDYRWFRSQYEDIQAQREQINNSYEAERQFHETYGDDPSEWSRQAETRHGRLHERITGNQNMLEQMVADYNARSSDATSAVWKCGLPYSVDERFGVAGPPGSGSPESPNDEFVNGSMAEKKPPEDCDSLPGQIEDSQ